MTVEQLYKQKFNSLLYYVRMKMNIKDSFDSTDLVQDAFFKITKRYGNDDVSNLDNILFITLHHECINFKKHLTYEGKYIDRLKREQLLNDDYELLKIEFDFVNYVYQKVNTLPLKCRWCVQLHYFEHKSPPEISKLLSISLSCVHSQLQRGRDLLRPHFNEKMLDR